MTSHPARLFLTCLIGIALPDHLQAQGAAYFQSLSMPPQDVGTCSALAPPSSPRPARLRGQRLLMEGRDPSREREIAIFFDESGKVVRFAEMGLVSTEATKADSYSIVAVIDSAGRAQGFITQHAIVLAGGGLERVDRAALRAMSEGATRASHKSLDAQAQGQVQTLVNWMRKRCPT